MKLFEMRGKKEKKRKRKRKERKKEKERKKKEKERKRNVQRTEKILEKGELIAAKVINIKRRETPKASSHINTTNPA